MGRITFPPVAMRLELSQIRREGAAFARFTSLQDVAVRLVEFVQFEVPFEKVLHLVFRPCVLIHTQLGVNVRPFFIGGMLAQKPTCMDVFIGEK